MNDVFTIAEAAARVKLSTKTLRRAIIDPVHPLRCYRPGRKILIAGADLDAWLWTHRAPAPTAAAGTLSPLVAGLLRGLNGRASESRPEGRRSKATGLRAPGAPGVRKERLEA